MIANRRILTDGMVEQIEALASRYPTKQALTLPALHVVHDALRHDPQEADVEIAQLLDLAPAEGQDTLTFYQFFYQTEPHGKVRAFVCRSISCALRGSEQVLDHLCKKAGIKPGETTSDGTITIEPAECLGACDFAPCMLAGNDLHKDLTPEKADAFLESVGRQNG